MRDNASLPPLDVSDVSKDSEHKRYIKKFKPNHRYKGKRQTKDHDSSNNQDKSDKDLDNNLAEL